MSQYLTALSFIYTCYPSFIDQDLSNGMINKSCCCVGYCSALTRQTVENSNDSHVVLRVSLSMN